MSRVDDMLMRYVIPCTVVLGLPLVAVLTVDSVVRTNLLQVALLAFAVLLTSVGLGWSRLRREGLSPDPVPEPSGPDFREYREHETLRWARPRLTFGPRARRVARRAAVVLVGLVALSAGIYATVIALDLTRPKSVVGRVAVVDKRGPAKSEPETVVAYDANLRERPDGDARRVGVAHFGTRLLVLAESSDKKWLEVRALREERPGQRGWVHRSLVTVH
jgi:hypothetical protein